MKKLLFIFSLFILIASAQGQNPSYQQKLYWTCKVWGYVKYFHSNVSVCGVNWDSVLVADLPLIKTAITKNDFNNALDTMLKAAGTMALTVSPPCDTVPPELSRNLNTTWVKDTSVFQNDVITILDTINNNFRPHAECWVQNNRYTNSYIGWLVFPYDSLIYGYNDRINYPDEWHRLLILFAHWNIINYFNPYNYIQNQPLDSTLYQNVINIDTASSDASFYTAFRKIASNMDDLHVNDFTYDIYCYAPNSGQYSPDLILKYIQGKYVVVKSGISGMTNGDEIISVNGLTTKQWEDSLKPYISAGDSASFHGIIMYDMLKEGYGDPIMLQYYDSMNNIQIISKTCSYLIPSYYPNDTLADAQWRYWSNCNIGYINVGKMQGSGSDISAMYSALQNTNAIIFDVRNYPASNAVFDIENNYLYSLGATPIVKFMAPNVAYPGTYQWVYQYASPGNPNPYRGKVIILFNEQTISEAEYAAMSLGELPNSIKIGSETAGTDGNVTYYYLSEKMETGFTTLGWFYPNGDSTERVGIIPDSLVYPTQAGIRAGRDEVLEKALQVAGCITSIPTINKPLEEITVYPNPSNGKFNVVISGKGPLDYNPRMEVYNVLGEKVPFTTLNLPTNAQDEKIISMSNEPNGIYFYRVLSESGALMGKGKIIIQK